MVGYRVLYTAAAKKDAQKLKAAQLDQRAKDLIEIIEENPFQTPPPYEKLVGDLKGAYSRRINIQHRLVHAVDKDKRQIRVLRMWTHYE